MEFSKPNIESKQYGGYKKPSWAPPSWVFGPVWTFLYALITISFGAVFWFALQSEIALIVTLPFILNIIFNVLYTWIQFGLKNYPLASLDVLLVLATLLWAIVVIFPLAPWIAYMQIPYLLWVSFATVLQLTVTYLNRGK